MVEEALNEIGAESAATLMKNLMKNLMRADYDQLHPDQKHR